MSPKSRAALLDHIFLNDPWPGVGDSEGLQPSKDAGVFWVRLHTSDPIDDASAFELFYPGYSKTSIARGRETLTREGNEIRNISKLSFGVNNGSEVAFTHFSIGNDDVLASGKFTEKITLRRGDKPVFDAGDLRAVAK